ncbi:MAG: tetratricopeptide repeat protein [bacterium]
MPESVLPLRRASLSLAIGQLYHAAGRPEELKHRLETMLAEPNLGFADKLELAGYYSTWLGEWSRAESPACSALQDEPGRPEPYSFLVGEYLRRDRRQGAIALLERWMEKNPNDGGAREELQRLREGKNVR